MIPNNRLIGVDIDLIHIRSTIDGYKILSSIKTDFFIDHAHCFPQNDLLGASCEFDYYSLIVIWNLKTNQMQSIFEVFLKINELCLIDQNKLLCSLNNYRYILCDYISGRFDENISEEKFEIKPVKSKINKKIKIFI